MKMPWDREAVRVLPVKIDLSKQPWCREALLLSIRGTGVLRWESRTLPPESDSLDISKCLTLRGTPLLSCLAAPCETSESRLCTGWGLDTADCPELSALREVLNGNITRLEDSVSALSPLLELLPKGLYVLAESDAYPTDGGGQFFWDVSDCLKPYPATAAAYLHDDDYEFFLEHLPPLFLYPSQQRSRLDMDRVKYYKERFQESGAFPHGFALHVMEGMSVLMDGHHKAAAAALLGRPLPCLTVFPLNQYLFRPVTAAKGMEKTAAGFGPFVIPLEDLSGIALPEKPWKRPRSSAPLPKGRLADMELPEVLLNAVKRFPTAEGYALMSAAGVSKPTDKELEIWLSDPENFHPQLRGALVYLRSRNDPRLKSTALRCAAVRDYKCSLKKEAFRVLAELKCDPEVEAFFIDYFVDLEEAPGVHGGAQDCLTQIAHSFWN